MTPSATGAALIATSALIHALWNLKAKSSIPTASFMLAANSVGALLLLLVLIPTGAIAQPLPATVWPILVVSAVFETLYYIGLGGAYLRGDLSAAYPVAKGLPVLAVALVSVFFFDHGVRGWPYSLGIGAIVLGIAFIAAWPSRKSNSGKPPMGFWTWVVLAAIGTAGYTLSDASALARMGHPPILATLTYLFWMCLVTSLLLTPVVIWQKRRRIGTGGGWKWADVLWVGGGMQASYALVLLSMGYLPNPGVVLALRQLSLPLTLLLSVWVLKEKAPAGRWAGMGLITAGVVAVKMA